MPLHSLGARTSTNDNSESDSISGPTTTTRPQTGRSRPRTAATSSGFENEILCAVSESRGISPTVGLAFVNLSTCEAVLCQFADTQTYARTCHKIKVFDPSEIIIPETSKESKLVSILEENLRGEQQDIIHTYLNRRYFNDETGHEYLQQLAFPSDLESLKISLVGQYFAVCSFAAVFRHLDLAMAEMFAPGTLRIKFEPSEGAMLIDVSTIASLELVQNLHNAKSKDCLFGLMNQTLTRMGTRILRSNILQPSTDKTKISKRYEAVQELSSQEPMFFAVREALEGFVDTDRVLAKLVIIQKRIDFVYMESSVNNILMLKSFVDSIMPVFEALTGAESQEIQDIRELCNPENYREVQQLIEYAINKDCKYSSKPVELENQRVYAIKAGVNGFLDIARTAYKEVRSDIELMAGELNDQHQIDLQLKFDSARQYFLRCKVARIEDGVLPEVFINIFRRKGWIECQTLDLMKMNQRLRDAHAEVISLSNTSIQELIEAIRSKIQPLFKISESIALLDMLASFAQMVTIHNWIKPEQLEETLAIKSGRHPILEKIHQQKLIPNDVYATPQKRFQIVTGCNMSGKSTYIRSIALMTIMAQVGCFIPAEYAGFPITTQLFARISTDDSIEANVSTFASEMREMAFILRTVDPRSLVIVDELGRGTSTTDGLCIAIAIAEALIESKAFVWFVTHFRDLPRVLAERAGVVNLHLKVDMNKDLSEMRMRYKIASGYEEQKYYGLALAKLMDLPPLVNEVAAKVSQALNERSEARKSNAQTLAIARRRKLVLALKEQLIQARESRLGNEELRLYLKKLQEEFVIRMSAIDAEAAAVKIGAKAGDRLTQQVGTGSHAEDPIEVSSDRGSPITNTQSIEGDCAVDNSPLVTPCAIKVEPASLRNEPSDDMIEDY